MRQNILFLFSQRSRSLYSVINMGRRKRHNKRNPLPYKNERNYQQTIKENELFKKYYAQLDLMPPEEVEDFYNQMKEPLPVTFRITGYKSQAKELMKILRTQFFNTLIGQSPSSSSSSNAANGASLGSGGDGAGDPQQTKMEVTEGSGEGEGGSEVKSDADTGERVTTGLTKEAIKPPKCLTWYPDELAWQIGLSRKAVRSQEILSKLHKFLVSETETGNISRQEAVSMIPPLVLDVQSDSKVLDMCAAPGSKTAQLIEYLHKDENSVPEGFVVANDKENKRCYLMVHQVKRLSSPCCMIVNHDASFFPKLRYSFPQGDDKPEHIMFDRVLADVPCSGDGTMRKNIDIWHKWHPAMGNAMHSLQLKILKRGLELLEVGGRIVYSTCSMQPVEDEAVIAEMLRKCQGTVELVDISSYLPGFKTVPGLSHWKLMNKQGNWVKDEHSVPDRFRQQFTKSMFPPTSEEAGKFNLHLCHRILPHHQDTGGFFVAALTKVTHLPWSREAHLQSEKANKPPETTTTADKTTAAETTSAAAEATLETPPEVSSSAPPEDCAMPPQGSEGSGSLGAECSNGVESGNGNGRKRKAETQEGPQPKKRELKGYREDPFLFLQNDDPVYPAIKEFYGLPDTFPVNQLLYRSDKGPQRALYFVNEALRNIVTSNEGRVRFINMGVKFVSRSPSPLVPSCDFRITQECLGSLKDMFGKRVVPVTKSDAITIFKEETPYLDKLSAATQTLLGDLCPGSVVFVYKPTESEPEPACEIAFCGWRGKTTVRCFVPQYERCHGLRLFGQDLSEIQAEVARMKAERSRSNATDPTTADDTDTATAAPDAEDDTLPDDADFAKEGEEEEDDNKEIEEEEKTDKPMDESSK